MLSAILLDECYGYFPRNSTNNSVNAAVMSNSAKIICWINLGVAAKFYVLQLPKTVTEEQLVFHQQHGWFDLLTLLDQHLHSESWILAGYCGTFC
mmetsp:Transcript_43077/g.90151  ORF Transcript_43077/g.90151 Transcript_43077/m.90151 type:complete len:95 (+) Transcript_43077:405-689(+)